MGRHDGHLPPRKHLNKAVQDKNPLDGSTADKATLNRLARSQGSKTKQDAKNARKGDRA